MGKITYKLSKPLEFQGKTISTLKMSEPSAETIEKSGDPLVLIDEDTFPKVDFKATRKLVGLLAGLPPSVTKDISVGDLRGVWFKFIPFLMPSEGLVV